MLIHAYRSPSSFADLLSRAFSRDRDRNASETGSTSGNERNGRANGDAMARQRPKAMMTADGVQGSDLSSTFSSYAGLSLLATGTRSSNC